MKQKWDALLVTSFLLLSGIGQNALADVINFDDLPAINAGNPIANGYAGFNWSNIFAFDPVQTGISSTSGYVTGVVSPSNDAFNGWGEPAVISKAGTFDFNGAWFTSALYPNNVLTLTGKAGGNTLYTLTATLNTGEPIWVNANFTGIDELDLSTSSAQFAMDNFTYNASVPFPIAPPLDDEEGLIMTKSDYSNFASRGYFDVKKTNHHGVDLALSPGGDRPASMDTAEKAVYPICDGTVEFVHNIGGKGSFVKIRHPNCNGQELIAYYGHIRVNDGLTEVRTDSPIGTVEDQKDLSHFHLSIDTRAERDLSSRNRVVCDYALDADQTVTSLSNCGVNTKKLAENKMRLEIGWEQVSTNGYTDTSGRTYNKNLYISETAIRQLGFISLFDLYD